MKKFYIIGIVIAAVLIMVGGVGAVVVQARSLGNAPATIVVNTQRNGTQNPQPFNYGPGGMMNGYGYGPGGMMNGYGRGGMMGGRRGEFGDGYGFMHEYMISAFANAVGLTVDQVNTDLQNGQTFTQIANAQGFTGDKLTQLVSQVRKDALAQAVKAGVITQSQADRMLQMMNNYTGLGFGPGFGFDGCPMWDDGAGGPNY